MSTRLASKKGGTRKHGRDQADCQRYRERGTREKNKLRKLRQILKLQPHNIQVKQLLVKGN